MLRKILCWLGFHEWERWQYTCNNLNKCSWYEDSGLIVCAKCKYNIFTCKHCGKVKE